MREQHVIWFVIALCGYAAGAAGGFLAGQQTAPEPTARVAVDQRAPAAPVPTTLEGVAVATQSRPQTAASR